MSRVLFLTHPEAEQDPAVPVTDWELAPQGRERMERFAAGPDVRGVGAVWSSRERKAAGAAAILAERLGLEPQTLEQLAESDRSATAGTAIHRAEDQPGQGHWFAFDRDSRELLHGWRPL